MPVSLDLHFVDELITARREAHGGNPGAPQIINGVRVGQSINRSCVVMLSALLQSYVEEVFVVCATEVLPKLAVEDNLVEFRKKGSRMGNPNKENIRSAFLRLGCRNVLADLSWRNSDNAKVLLRLKEINELRNGIAHGKRQLTIDGNPVSLDLRKVEVLRNFARAFGERFEVHALAKVS
ncbi:HEPN domain-containing protein [Roseibium aggregatum]|uniref:HEPN domain-containing protein n=1 Tax=Roseibium aggregatum TaxID=187304 RepID=UPI001E3B699B|nr:HEPN domain-containing protein [Roseibium aggregatum]UES49686.1 hypothetical protein GFK88_08725 [Roseibium aggregatum]